MCFNVFLLQPGEQDESVCKTYLTKIKDLRLRLEGCETRTVTRLRQPVDKEPLKACALKTAEQMVTSRELTKTGAQEKASPTLILVFLCNRKSSQSWRA